MEHRDLPAESRFRLAQPFATSGSGSAQITVQASGSGFEPGAYHAELVIQGPNLSPA